MATFYGKINTLRWEHKVGQAPALSKQVRGSELHTGESYHRSLAEENIPFNQSRNSCFFKNYSSSACLELIKSLKSSNQVPEFQAKFPA